MLVELDRKGLECLVKGSELWYSEFDNELVKKAQHGLYYGKNEWGSLKSLTEEELYQLHLICVNSWPKKGDNYAKGL